MRIRNPLGAARRAGVQIPPSPPKKKDHPQGGPSFLTVWDLNRLNATVRWTVACRQLDGGNTIMYSNPSISIDQAEPACGVVFSLAMEGFETIRWYSPVDVLCQKFLTKLVIVRSEATWQSASQLLRYIAGMD